MIEKNTEQKIRFYELFAQLVSAMCYKHSVD